MKLLWLDLETEGLDPKTDHVLEVYAAIADLSNPFEIEKEIGSFVISHAYRTATGDLGYALADYAHEWNPFVREMHTKNGLIADMAAGSLTTEDVEGLILPHLPEIEGHDDLTTLAGSTVHFDLGFLRQWMPTLAKRLHYRVFDVSSIKLLARAFGREKWLKAEAHRARADVLESIRHGREAAEFITFKGYRDEIETLGPADPFETLNRYSIVDVSRDPGKVRG